MVKLLASMGLKIIYHEIHDEKHGQESIPTYYQYLHEDEPYHLDYVFSRDDFVKNFEMGTFKEFVASEDKKSDHVPLIFEVGE